MDIDVRPFSGDPNDFFAAGELAFSEQARDEDRERWARAFEADRAIAAYDGEHHVRGRAPDARAPGDPGADDASPAGRVPRGGRATGDPLGLGGQHLPA